MALLSTISLLGKKIITTTSKTATIIVRNASSTFLRSSPNNALSKAILLRYKKLKRPKGLIQATYLWIDGTGEHIRLKDRILHAKKIRCVEELPKWHYDGSSTYQASGKNSEITIIPRAMYKDPFKNGKKDIIVMCDTYDAKGEPTKTNHRKACQEAMEHAEEHVPQFGIEQEYTLLDVDDIPFGWPKIGFPAPQGPYYCAVGANRVFCRDLAEAHIAACLYAGVDLCGTNSEVLPGQWEYQIGITTGIKAADDLWVSRYILQRIAEELGVVVAFDPKPVSGPWNGTGGHTNFSTKEMREDGGLEVIKEAIKKLEKNHLKHIKVYDPKGGEDNKRRLVGALETSSIDKFSWGIANRGVSIRIARDVAAAGKGYLEDRRPAANMDPYVVCNALVRTCILDE